MIWKTHFVPAPPPIFDKPTGMKIIEREKISIGERITIEVTGEGFTWNIKILFNSKTISTNKV